MRKRIAQFGAAAALMMAGGAMKGGRDLVRRGPTGSEASDALSVRHEAFIIKTMFARANTIEEFNAAQELWDNRRPDLVKYERSLNCEDYGQAHDAELLQNLVDEIAKKPVGLMIDVGKLVLEFAAVEKDEAGESLTKTVRDLGELIEDKGKAKIAKLTSADRAKIIQRFKEALLKYLQKKFKRSRQYFLRIIGDICSIAEAYGTLLIDLGKVAVTPSKTNPDDCGTEQGIERERSSALRRVFVSPNQSTLNISPN